MAASKPVIKLVAARLRNSIELLLNLEQDASLEENHATLEEVLENGEKNLTQMGGMDEPELVRRTHMTMAQAQLRMASLAQAGSERQARIGAAADHCELALAQVPDSAPVHAHLEISAWAITLLTGACRMSTGVQQQALNRRLTNSLGQFENYLRKQINQRLDSADMIFAGQLLLEGARNVADSEERQFALKSALALAEQAAGLLDNAGDVEMTGQARALAQEINATV
jgi:hypothetical protein